MLTLKLWKPLLEPETGFMLTQPGEELLWGRKFKVLVWIYNQECLEQFKNEVIILTHDSKHYQVKFYNKLQVKAWPELGEHGQLH